MSLRWILPTICLLAPFSWGANAQAGQKPLLQIKIADKTYEGKSVAHNDREFWLMSRDGSLTEVKFAQLADFKKTTVKFQADSLTELRDALKRIYGRDLEVVAKGSYIVCGPRGRAREYAKLLDSIYHRFYSYFRVRKLKITKPEFPMVALIFPDHTGFARYASGDGVRAVRGLMGYYHPHTNRVALFDPGEQTARLDGGHSAPQPFTSLAESTPPFAELTTDVFAATGSSDSGLRDTMIHEATHQVAFNTGLHNRIGENPKWIVEGLATVFEAPGIREGSSYAQAEERINRERFVWFMNYLEKRRPKDSLENFISDDRYFTRSMLDGYAQAWALSFYLIETRSSDYAKFLRIVAQRDPLKPYRAEDRLEDFRKAFGKNLSVLDASFVRFMQNMAQKVSR